MPPKPPDVAHFDTGRSSRIILPNGVCPNWFKGGQDVLFLPLAWKDELNLPNERKLEVLLICDAEIDFVRGDWFINPREVMNNHNDSPSPEEDRERLLIYESKLSLAKQQWRLNCPPMVKALCDDQKRLYALEHSLGVTIWSPKAFNEHYG